METTDHKILQLLEALKAAGTIRFDVDFCNDIGIKKGNLWNVKNGHTHFTVEHINTICRKYRANPNWIFGLSDKMFRISKEVMS